MFFLLFLAPLVFSRRRRSRRSRFARILDAINDDAEKPNDAGDRFILLSTLLEKPESFGLTWGEARTLLMLSALKRQETE